MVGLWHRRTRGHVEKNSVPLTKLEPTSHQVIEQPEGNSGESASRCPDPHDEDMVLDPGISRSAWWT